MIQLTSVMVGHMPGNALKVLMVLMLERGPRSKKFLMAAADMSDKTLSKALDQLAMMGMITHNGGHIYQIANGVQQLPLMAGELPEPQEEAVDKPVDKSVDNVFDIPAGEVKSRNISDFSSHACMHDSESLTPDLKPEIPACIHGENSENFRTDLEAALIKVGFRDPGLSRLRIQAGLTARIVRYHVREAPSLGAALTRIEKNWHVPDSFEPEDKYRNCSRCCHITLRTGLAWIDELPVCFDCMSDGEYEQYGPDG